MGIYLWNLTAKYTSFKNLLKKKKKNCWITATKYGYNAHIFNYTINNVLDFVPTAVEVIAKIYKHFTFITK